MHVFCLWSVLHLRSSGKVKKFPVSVTSENPAPDSWVFVRQYCAKIDEAARNRMELIVPELAKRNGVTEKLKPTPNGMGTADERLQGTGRGNCESGIDL